MVARLVRRSPSYICRACSSGLNSPKSFARPSRTKANRPPLPARSHHKNSSPCRSLNDRVLADLGFIYDYIDGAEDVNKCRSGGFHPVRLDDKFHGRYTVIDKLGHGGRSTVWLAWDKCCHKYVAMKICIADDEVVSQGVEIIRHVSQLRSHRTQALLDEFSLSGPNGTHTCLVTEVAAMSLADAKEASGCKLFEVKTARKLAVQLIQAVCSLHGNGIVHGDLHLSNILLRMKSNIDKMSHDELHDKYGLPETEPVKSLDGMPLDDAVPTELILPIWMGKKSEEITVDEADLFLTDFDEAYMPSTTARTSSNTPLMYQPPEAQFSDTQLSYSADIWSLGCVLWLLVGQRALFDRWVSTSDELLDEHVTLLGKLPQDWWLKWDARHKYWEEKGKETGEVKPRGEQKIQSWEERFTQAVTRSREETGIDTMKDEERVDFLDLMRRVMRLRPEERLSAKEVLESKWVQKWCQAYL